MGRVGGGMITYLYLYAGTVAAVGRVEAISNYNMY